MLFYVKDVNGNDCTSTEKANQNLSALVKKLSLFFVILWAVVVA